MKGISDRSGTLVAMWAGGVEPHKSEPEEVRYAVYTQIHRRAVDTVLCNQHRSLSEVTTAARIGYVRKGRPFDLPEWVHTRMALVRMLPSVYDVSPDFPSGGALKRNPAFVPGVGINVGTVCHELYDLFLYVSVAELGELRGLLSRQSDWRVRKREPWSLIPGCKICMANAHGTVGEPCERVDYGEPDE